MENKIILEDDNELINITIQIWKQERNKGLRSIHRITTKILAEYK